MATSYAMENNNFTSSKTILIAENTEYEIENTYILKSPYIRNIKAKLGDNEDLRIILPKWVTKFSLEKILFYLKYNQLPDFVDSNESAMQRLLWLSDFLRLDEFQHRFIKEKILPLLNYSNCLTFLNESFKKLKTSEESSDSWYLLFNYSMNVMAKNLGWVFQNKKAELMQVNEKILEEIGERSLKQHSSIFNADQKDIIEILMHARKKNDALELLDSQRKAILAKKYSSSSNQPNITWKLSNLSKITEKETAAFQFGGFSWKLVARMQKDDITGSEQLAFYLKLDNPIDPNDSFLTNKSQNFSKQNSMTNSARNLALTGTPSEGILTVYFAMKANGSFVHKDIQIKSMNFEKNPVIKLYVLEQYEIAHLPVENELVVNLNLEYTYSTILLHIAKNIELFYTSQNIPLLSKDDLIVLLKHLPNVTAAQDQGLTMSSVWIQTTKDEKEAVEVLRSLEWNCISIGTLMKIFNSPAIKANAMATQFLEREIAKKMSGGDNSYNEKNSALKSSYMSDVGRQKRDTTADNFMREPLKQNASQQFLQRGRFFNQNNPQVEQPVDHPRHSSLQREPLSRPSSLNTSMKANEMPYVPRLLQNKTVATETSPSPNNRIFNSRFSSSPRRYHGEDSSRTTDFRTKTFSQPGSNQPSLSNLNYGDQRTSLQHSMQSPPSNLGFQSATNLSSMMSTEGKKDMSPTPLSANKGMYDGYSAGNTFTSPMTSPTYKPGMPGNLSTSSNAAFFSNSSKDMQLNSPEGQGSMKNLGLSSSLKTQRRSLEKRVMTEAEEGLGSRSREASLNRGGRESYSDPVDFRRLHPDRFERKSIEEVRESYSVLEKSTQEKIMIIRRVLYQEKEAMKNDIFSSLDVANFVVNGRTDMFV